MELTWRREQGLEQARQCWWCGHSCQGAPRGECLGPRGGSTGLSWSPGSSGLAPGPLPPVRRMSDSPLEASPHPVSQLSKGSWTEGLASSRNRMPKGSAAGRARCWATDPPLMPFRPPSPPQELVGKLLQLHFKDDKTKVSGDALRLVAELLKIFVVAAIRSVRQAQAEDLALVDVDQLEKVLPQLLLDF
uniref:centromere protein X isoform X2 n=1 Tax=Panthera onca TaxID=9690 RepID=UPI0029552205|nr:centromere protein X isoform X2 [Panthera onca]